MLIRQIGIKGGVHTYDIIALNFYTEPLLSFYRDYSYSPAMNEEEKKVDCKMEDRGSGMNLCTNPWNYMHSIMTNTMYVNTFFLIHSGILFSRDLFNCLVISSRSDLNDKESRIRRFWI